MFGTLYAVQSAPTSLAFTWNTQYNHIAHTGLLNEKGFLAFCKEVTVLSKLDHVNIIALVGYVRKPSTL